MNIIIIIIVIIICIAIFFSFFFWEKKTRLLGFTYSFFFRIFKFLYFLLILLPIRTLFFIYFPIEHKLRIALRKSKYNRINNFLGFQFLPFNRNAYNLNDVRFKNVKSSITHSPASTFSIILSYLAFILTVFLELINKQNDYTIFNLNIWFVLLGVCFILLAPLPIYLRFYILNLPIEEYASLIKSSLNESEMISFISYKIWRACERFRQNTKWLINEECLIDKELHQKFYKQWKIELQNELKIEITKRAKNLIKNKTKIKSLKKEIQIIDVELQRISILIKYCANRIKIPEVELCEHIFQFSPSMYNSWIRKFADNIDTVNDIWTQILSADHRGPHMSFEINFYEKVVSSLSECSRFLSRNQHFQEYQSQNIAFAEINDNIIGYSSNLSSCEALKIYISTISENAYEINKYLNRNGNNNIEDYSIEKFKYVFYKRKAHNGLDLHYSAYQLLCKMVSWDDVDIKNYYNGLIEAFELTAFEGFLKKKNDLLSKYIDQLARFHSYSVAYVEHTRNKVRESFVEKCSDFFNVNSEQYLYVVTFGFSKIVSDIFKKDIPELILKGNPSNNQRIKIVVFFSEEESKIESRQIKYYLTEDRYLSTIHIPVSNPGFILPLLNNNSKLLIIMGCEAYDGQKRIIRTNTYKESFKKFIEEAKKRMCLIDRVVTQTDNQKEIEENIKVIVCAESFKNCTDLRAIDVYFDDQHDKIEMYEPELISEIITD